MVSREGEARLGRGNPPGRLPGKSAKEGFRIRTTNRHRWTRRKFSGARVMDCSGTRQISSVTSGKGVPWWGGPAIRRNRSLTVAAQNGAAVRKGKVRGAAGPLYRG